MNAGDLDAWLRMRLELWPGEPESHLVEMQANLQDPDCANFIALESSGAACGFIEAGMRKYAEGCDSSPVGYIEGWYVEEAYRRMGVGAALVRAVENWASSQGCSEMASDCLIDNLVSLGAHTALGYEEVERLIHFRKLLIG